MNKNAYAIQPAADGQQSYQTLHPAIYQEALTWGAREAESWFAKQADLTLVECLDNLLARAPASAAVAVRDGFLLRIQQRLHALEGSPARMPHPAALINQSLLFETLQASLELADEYLDATGDALADYTEAVRTLKAQATEVARANTLVLLAANAGSAEQGGTGHD